MGTEYRLARTRSAAVVRSSSADSRPTILVILFSPALVTKSYSVPDITAYIRASDRYKPQWPLYYTYNPYRYSQPYRYHRDYSLHDTYWNDHYYYFSPLYYSSLFPHRRYHHSDHLPNPYYWPNYPYNSTYWTRYKSYLYDYDYPYYWRRFTDPYYYSYLNTSYRPYRSYLLDSMTHSLLGGLDLYRKGVIPFSVLNQRWLRPNDWAQQFKDWRLLYKWNNADIIHYMPNYLNREARQHTSAWVKVVEASE